MATNKTDGYRLPNWSNLDDSLKQRLAFGFGGRRVRAVNFRELAPLDLVRLTDTVGSKFLLELVDPPQRQALVLKLSWGALNSSDKSGADYWGLCWLSSIILGKGEPILFGSENFWKKTGDIYSIEMLEERARSLADF